MEETNIGIVKNLCAVKIFAMSIHIMTKPNNGVKKRIIVIFSWMEEMSKEEISAFSNQSHAIRNYNGMVKRIDK
jgi:hypothetical protein